MRHGFSTRISGSVQIIELRIRVPYDGRLAGIRKVLEDSATNAESIYGAHSGEAATIRELIEKL